MSQEKSAAVEGSQTVETAFFEILKTSKINDLLVVWRTWQSRLKISQNRL
jgi:hypothetical protein